MLQKITTQEPDDSQLEVALAALKKSLWYERVAADSPQTDDAPAWGCTVYSSYLEIEAPPATG